MKRLKILMVMVMAILAVVPAWGFISTPGETEFLKSLVVDGYKYDLYVCYEANHPECIYSQWAILSKAPANISGVLDIPNEVSNDGENYEVRGVKNGVFKNRTALRQVNFPDRMNIQADSLFYGCTSLVKVTGSRNAYHPQAPYGFDRYSIVPNQAGPYAFANCGSLEEMFYGPVPIGCYENCTSLTEVSVGAYYNDFDGSPIKSSVPKNAFKGCTSLAKVEISGGSIEKDAFAGCTGINEISFSHLFNCYPSSPGALPTLDHEVKVTISDGYGSLADSCFWEVLRILHPLQNISLELQYGGPGHLNDDLVPGLRTVTFGEDVSSVPPEAFKGNTGLRKVIFGSAMKYVDEAAFRDCTSLTSINLNEGMVIKYGAFAGCSSLSAATLKLVDCSVMGGAFSGCSSLSPANLALVGCSVGSEAFAGCQGLKSVTVDNCSAGFYYGPGVYGPGVFPGCNNLEKVTFSNQEGKGFLLGQVDSKSLDVYVSDNKWGFKEMRESMGIADNVHLHLPEGLTSIPKESFKGLSGLVSVDLPQGLEELGDNAFSATGLTEISFPSSLKSVLYSFRDCPNLTRVNASGDGAIISNLDFTGSPVAVLSLGGRITAEGLGIDGWGGMYALDSLIVTGSDVMLGPVIDSPLRCAKLSPLRELPDKAFSGCRKLNHLELPEGITTIPDEAFHGCESLPGFEFPESLHTIGANAFSGCDSFTSVDLPATLSSVGEDAFSECSALKTVTVDMDEVPDDCFPLCQNLSSVKLGQNVKHIGGRAFQVCTSLTDINFPDGLTSIGDQAFSSTTFEGQTLDLGKNLEEIGWNAFGCANPSKIVFGQKFRKLGDGNFTEADGVKSIYCYNPEMPEAGGYDFNSEIFRTTALFVPKGRVPWYGTDPFWKQFRYIYEIDDSAIDEVGSRKEDWTVVNGAISFTGDGRSYAVYGLDGSLIASGTSAQGVTVALHPGVYVMVVNGVARKIAVE